MRTKCAISDVFSSSEIVFLRTVLVWLSTCIPYQLSIVSDYAITQYRTNASKIAHLVRIVCSGLNWSPQFAAPVKRGSHHPVTYLVVGTEGPRHAMASISTRAPLRVSVDVSRVISRGCSLLLSRSPIQHRVLTERAMRWRHTARSTPRHLHRVPFPTPHPAEARRFPTAFPIDCQPRHASPQHIDRSSCVAALLARLLTPPVHGAAILAHCQRVGCCDACVNIQRCLDGG